MGDGDFIDQSASAVFPDTATNRMLSMIHKKVAEHRTALGFPPGGNGFPQFYVSNDLCSKFGQAMKLFVDSEIDLSAKWIVELARNFVASYDEQQTSFRHTAPKESAIRVLEQYEEIERQAYPPRPPSRRDRASGETPSA